MTGLQTLEGSVGGHKKNGCRWAAIPPADSSAYGMPDPIDRLLVMALVSLAPG
jgi:hypothetical protein